MSRVRTYSLRAVRSRRPCPILRPCPRAIVIPLVVVPRLRRRGILVNEVSFSFVPFLSVVYRSLLLHAETLYWLLTPSLSSSFALFSPRSFFLSFPFSFPLFSLFPFYFLLFSSISSLFLSPPFLILSLFSLPLLSPLVSFLFLSSLSRPSFSPSTCTSALTFTHLTCEPRRSLRAWKKKISNLRAH